MCGGGLVWFGGLFALGCLYGVVCVVKQSMFCCMHRLSRNCMVCTLRAQSWLVWGFLVFLVFFSLLLFDFVRLRLVIVWNDKLIRSLSCFPVPFFLFHCSFCEL